jgi:hypothetical protein
MRDDSGKAFGLLLLAVLVLGHDVDWHHVAVVATSVAGLTVALFVAIVGCLLVSAGERRPAPARAPRVRRKDRPIIGQPAYWAA